MKNALADPPADPMATQFVLQLPLSISPTAAVDGRKLATSMKKKIKIVQARKKYQM